jgi:hypothetical protein
MDIQENKPYTNWISIIRVPGSVKTIVFKKDEMSMIETIKLEWPKTEFMHILRWEDDGGKIIETNYLIMPDPPFVQTRPIHEVMLDTSLPWRQEFVIEPFQADAGIRLIKRNAPTKK